MVKGIQDKLYVYSVKISIPMLDLPVWSVGSKTFTNKFTAMVAGKNTKNSIHFDLYDSAFLDFDWEYVDPETL